MRIGDARELRTVRSRRPSRITSILSFDIAFFIVYSISCTQLNRWMKLTTEWRMVNEERMAELRITFAIVCSSISSMQIWAEHRGSVCIHALISRRSSKSCTVFVHICIYGIRWSWCSLNFYISNFSLIFLHSCHSEPLMFRSIRFRAVLFATFDH